MVTHLALVRNTSVAITKAVALYVGKDRDEKPFSNLKVNQARIV